MTWVRHWHKHPGVRHKDELTVGERAADHMRNGMGSWTFVFCFLVIMVIWAAGNSIFHVGGRHGFDPYPYILLNLVLSTLAGLQAAALLIAAKRADQISSEIAIHTEHNTDDLKQLLSENTELTKVIRGLVQQNTDLTNAVQQMLTQVHSHLVGAG